RDGYILPGENRLKFSHFICQIESILGRNLSYSLSSLILTLSQIGRNIGGVPEFANLFYQRKLNSIECGGGCDSGGVKCVSGGVKCGGGCEYMECRWCEVWRSGEECTVRWCAMRSGLLVAAATATSGVGGGGKHRHSLVELVVAALAPTVVDLWWSWWLVCGSMWDEIQKYVEEIDGRMGSDEGCGVQLDRNREFVELGSILEPGRSPKLDKAAILSDVVRMVTQLRGESEKLKESNESLQEKIKELKGMNTIYSSTTGCAITYRIVSTNFSVQLSWIMELLESNLETKSKIYKDSALSYVFFINNGRYIVSKVKDGELASLLGDDWIRKRTAKVRQNHLNYQKSSWGRVLATFKLDNNSLAPNVAAKSMKEKLKVFNMHFEDVCRTQSNWVVADEQLQSELRV
ncbi:hypothetical protein IFM89_038982, partial [Coptis chinensis]